MAGIQWRSLCRVLHRDLGYLFFGATVVYAVSGIAINHRSDWNPSYSVTKRESPLPPTATNQPLTETDAIAVLKEAGVTAAYLSHYSPEPGQERVFFDGGNATLNRAAKTLVIETVRRRPVLYVFNKLHYNPGRWWTWFADLFSLALAVVAVTGLFLLRGKQAITRRGGVLVAAGILIPAILALLCF